MSPASTPASAVYPAHEPDPSGVPEDASSAAPGRRGGDDLLLGLAERLGARVASTTVYGAPVERDGVTVVPVATARLCLGAGSGSDPAKGQEGGGGGGLGSVTPAGYIELKNGRSRFVPVIDPARVVALLGAALAVAGTVARPRLGGAGHQRDRRWRRR